LSLDDGGIQVPEALRPREPRLEDAIVWSLFLLSVKRSTS
jgi:hypothetical protein